MNLEVRYDAEKKLFSIAVPGGQQIPAINEWPGWKRHPSGTYQAPAWPSSILAMTKTVHPLRWEEGAANARDNLLTNLQRLRDSLGADKWSPWRLPTERMPKTHQRQAVGALRWASWRALLADDMGLGKTSTALWAAHDAGVTRILVICPVSVKFNWQNEIKATLGDSWATHVIDGTAKKRAQQLLDARHRSSKSDAIVINYDLLRHLSDQQIQDLQAFVSEGMLFLDESHYLKSRSSDRTELCAKIAAHAPYVIAMTGTPIRNLADDLYSQVEIVRPGTWTSYRDFAKRHLVIQSVKFGKREVNKVVGVRNLDALNAVMNTLQIKRAKHDVLDLPPKTYTFPELQLDGDHLKIYKAMKDFAKLELHALMTTRDAHLGPLTDGVKMNIFDPRARSAIEQAMRCEQIANGFIGGIPDPIMQSIGPDILKLGEKVTGRKNELMFPTSPKAIWILETIESVLAQGGAPIVYSRFNAPLIWLFFKLAKEGTKVGLLHGGLEASEKAACIANFQSNGVDVLLCQVKIAEGWNATRCQDVIFWTRDWSPAVNMQAEDRAHRMGQKGTVNVQVPIVRNSIERMIHARLSAKQADAEQALRTVTIEELMEAL